MKTYLPETLRLCLVAVVASVLTAFVLKVNEPPQVVQAAPQADILPPIFKKDATMASSISSSKVSATRGKVIQVWGTWLEMTDGDSTWWVDVNNPEVYFTK